MDDTNRDLVSLISVILLLIIRQSSINITVQQFFARRHRRRRFRLRYLQGLSALYLNLRARRQFARRPRRAWVFPRPQNWFQELLNNNALDHWWKENFIEFRAIPLNIYASSLDRRSSGKTLGCEMPFQFQSASVQASGD